MNLHPTFVIVNPAAGNGKCGLRARAELYALRESGMQMTVVWTNSPGNATVLARKAYLEGHREFLVVGGDGTTYEVINGLFPEAQNDLDNLPTIGFLPLGTGNSFLRDFGKESEIVAKQALHDGSVRNVDIIALEHSNGVIYSLNILSLGFVAKIGATTNRYFKRLGEAGYVAGTILEVARLQHDRLPIKIDGGEFRQTPVTFLSFNNSKFTGGKMMMAPNAEVADGKMDVITVDIMSRIELLRTFPRIFKGTHIESPKVHTERAKEVIFNLQNKVDIMVDGEIVSLLPRKLSVLPKAIKVRV